MSLITIETSRLGMNSVIDLIPRPDEEDGDEQLGKEPEGRRNKVFLWGGGNEQFNPATRHWRSIEV